MNCDQNTSKSRLVWSKIERSEMRDRLNERKAILTAGLEYARSSSESVTRP